MGRGGGVQGLGFRAPPEKGPTKMGPPRGVLREGCSDLAHGRSLGSYCCFLFWGLWGSFLFVFWCFLGLWGFLFFCLGLGSFSGTSVLTLPIAAVPLPSYRLLKGGGFKGG